jgi:translation initiation factor 1A
MVKNTKGGNTNKKFARKNISVENVRHKTRLADPKEPCEMYAIVTKMLGQGNCEVLCNDGKKRLCVIRKKFKGRNKRNNIISPQSIILIGIRDWEVVAQDKKQKCDLLEVYERYMYDDIKKDTNSNWNMLYSVIQEETHNEDAFDFEDADGLILENNVDIDKI